MERPCKHPFCTNVLPEDARPDKEWCSDICGREGRRMKTDPEFAFLRTAEAFYAGLRRIRRLTPGQLVKDGRNRRTISKAVTV